MAFISEYVSRKDWDLYNSFEFINKSINSGQIKQANDNSIWKVDRDRDIYFVRTGAIGREEIDYYTLVWKGKKVNIVAGFERRFDNGMQRGYKVSSIIADIKLQSRECEYLEIIKEVLLLGWENGLDFIEFAEPKYREEIN